MILLERIYFMSQYYWIQPMIFRYVYRWLVHPRIRIRENLNYWEGFEE